MCYCTWYQQRYYISSMSQMYLHFQVPNPVNVIFKVTLRDQHLLAPSYGVGPSSPLRARYAHIKHHHQPVLRCAEEAVVTA